MVALNRELSGAFLPLVLESHANIPSVSARQRMRMIISPCSHLMVGTKQHPLEWFPLQKLSPPLKNTQVPFERHVQVLIVGESQNVPVGERAHMFVGEGQTIPEKNDSKSIVTLVLNIFAHRNIACLQQQITLHMLSEAVLDLVKFSDENAYCKNTLQIYCTVQKTNGGYG